jgi:serine/threonine-protein kinase
MPMSLPDASVAPVHEGEVLDGKYRVDKVLGVGGMGVVVAATHVQLSTKVALKFLLPQALANQQVIERFAREARAAVQIQSEHVARVSDVGTLPTGSPYMVMEFLEGGDLSDVIAKNGPLPVETAVGYVLQASEAIAEAHSLGIVHRDLKPANLFLARKAGRDPLVKVLDFGISKTNESGGGLTATTAVMGSPFYMAPEQMMSSKDVDARSDVWAMGVILYELLTGIAPFAADSMPEVVFNVTQRDAEPIQNKRPDVPPGIAAAIAKCLARDRAHRFQNVAEFVSAIAPFGPPRSEVSVERVSRLLGAAPPAVSFRSSGDLTGAAQGKKQGTSATWGSSSGAEAASQPAASPKSKLGMYAAIGGAALVICLVAMVGFQLKGGTPKTEEASGHAATTGPAVSQAATLPAASSAPAAPAAASSSPPAASTAETVTLAPTPTPTAAVAVPTARAATGPARAHATPAPASPPAQTQAAAPPPPQSNGNRLNMGMKE